MAQEGVMQTFWCRQSAAIRASQQFHAGKSYFQTLYITMKLAIMTIITTTIHKHTCLRPPPQQDGDDLPYGPGLSSLALPSPAQLLSCLALRAKQL
eukprot:7492692-Heterocapsa_arctica.AAC.1